MQEVEEEYAKIEKLEAEVVEGGDRFGQIKSAVLVLKGFWVEGSVGVGGRGFQEGKMELQIGWPFEQERETFRVFIPDGEGLRDVGGDDGVRVRIVKFCKSRDVDVKERMPNQGPLPPPMKARAKRPPVMKSVVIDKKEDCCFLVLRLVPGGQEEGGKDEHYERIGMVLHHQTKDSPLLREFDSLSIEETMTIL